MKSYQHVIKDINRLKEFLCSQEISSNVKNAESILVQVYSSTTDQTWIKSITQVIEEELPTAILVGSTTAGEIAEGCLMIGTTVLSVSFFDSALIRPIAIDCSLGDESNCGQYLSQAIDEIGLDIAGVLLLATPLGIDVAKLFSGMSPSSSNYPIFGGGAGAYTLLNDLRLNHSFIFYGKNYFTHGVIAVVFLGENLHICSHTYLGWQPLSKEMTITEIEGMLVKKIDGENAFQMYKRYLGIENDNEFFLNVLEFPFLLKREGKTIARVPFYVDQNGNIGFVGDLSVGEKFRIGYGDPETIIQNTKEMEKVMEEFAPNSIFLFNCICHRNLMQNEANLETQPFNAISPTVGFYTYGEFSGDNNKIQVLNSTMIVVGMREGEKPKKFREIDNTQINKAKNKRFIDPYANKHYRIISRLVHFISVITADLEQANKDLTRISEIDKLTQIYNRLKLDNILEYEINNREQNHIELSIIMMDIDRFKLVNDSYGHIIGDDVIVQITNIIKGELRETDYAGRWGGEEFLIILPQTNLEEAGALAEKMRATIDLFTFPVANHQTCSFGVSSYSVGDTQDDLVLRADNALYEAKRNGRNKVILSTLK